MIPPPEMKQTPRKRTWPGYALVGFFAGIVTVVLVVVWWKQLRG